MSTLSARSQIDRNSKSSPQIARSPTRHPLGIGPVVWMPPKDDLIHGEWMLIGRHLGAISRCSQWWIGDWVLYGTAKWGEKYSDAARATGYDPRSLANMASVAHAFPPSRRRDNLTWSHHAAMAGLNAGEQDRWLDQAVSERLSVADLRTELRRKRLSRVVKSNRHHSINHIFTCPHCKADIKIDEATISIIDARSRLAT
jgi:hypothetical protein